MTGAPAADRPRAYADCYAPYRARSRARPGPARNDLAAGDGQLCRSTDYSRHCCPSYWHPGMKHPPGEPMTLGNMRQRRPL